METSIDSKLKICLTKLDYLKSISDCPKLYLINQFQNCITDIDLSCENLLLNELDVIDKETINKNREKIIKKVNEFEKKCINIFNSKQHKVKNYENVIQFIETKIKNINKSNKCGLDNQIDEILYLIDYETYRFKKYIFNDENVIFFNKKLCQKYIFNFNNYDDIFDTESEVQNTTNEKILFGVLVYLNGYVSKTKLM